jgi:peroxiredoxin
MKTLIASLALAAMVLASPAGATLAVGAKAPNFTTRGARAGKTFTLTLAHQLKRGPVVLYFFPKAGTPGCSAEAKAFAENITKFEAAGATVIGMSADPVDDLVAFSEKECAGKFPVASAGPTIITGYDAALAERPGMTDRISYVIAPSGRIAFVHNERNYRGHVQSTLSYVEALKQK